MPLGKSKDGKVAGEAKQFSDEVLKRHQKKVRDLLLEAKKHPMPLLVGGKPLILSFDKTAGFIVTAETDSIKFINEKQLWQAIEDNKDLNI